MIKTQMDTQQLARAPPANTKLVEILYNVVDNSLEQLELDNNDRGYIRAASLLEHRALKYITIYHLRDTARNCPDEMHFGQEEFRFLGNGGKTILSRAWAVKLLKLPYELDYEGRNNEILKRIKEAKNKKLRFDVDEKAGEDEGKDPFRHATL